MLLHFEAMISLLVLAHLCLRCPGDHHHVVAWGIPNVQSLTLEIVKIAVCVQCVGWSGVGGRVGGTVRVQIHGLTFITLVHCLQALPEP